MGFEPAGRAQRPGSIEVVYSARPVAYNAGVFTKSLLAAVGLPGNGPRGLAVSPDGKLLATAQYFSGDVALLDARSGALRSTVALGPATPPDDARRGEAVFHDATRCWQHWLSCATCHPDGRADGLNWDLLNDGIGNPKNTKSLVLSHRTPPAMWRGVRKDMAAAAAAGFRHLLFRPGSADDLRAVWAHLSSLRLAPSPRLIKGRLSAPALRGRALFESPGTGCADCHPAPLLTDLEMHDVGTAAEGDGDDRTFDTPSLLELWRTAPYLHHGQAANVRDLLTTFNKADRHGRTSHLTPGELNDLVEYLLSL
jgi:cytochrome c peroxidase